MKHTWTRFVAALAMGAFTAVAAPSNDVVSLTGAALPQGGWTFGNGPEFPGAAGELALDAAGGRQGAPALVLQGDFALDVVLQAGEIDWAFDNGREFPGAKGTLTLVKDRPKPARTP